MKFIVYKYCSDSDKVFRRHVRDTYRDISDAINHCNVASREFDEVYVVVKEGEIVYPVNFMAETHFSQF